MFRIRGFLVESGTQTSVAQICHDVRERSFWGIFRGEIVFCLEFTRFFLVDILAICTKVASKHTAWYCTSVYLCSDVPHRCVGRIIRNPWMREPTCWSVLNRTKTFFSSRCHLACFSWRRMPSIFLCRCATNVEPASRPN